MKEKTAENVHTAFVGEAKAYQRLLEFARKADQEELPQIAYLFRAVAESEKIHTQRHFRLLEKTKDTQSNMEYAFQQENAVNGTYYPQMIKDAEDEDEKAAVLVFSQARDVEQVHAKLYKHSLANLVAEEDTQYYICNVCGYLHEKSAPDECPVCKAKKDHFSLVK